MDENYYIVGANVVNQPLSSWLHWNLDAVKPYLPDLGETQEQSDPGQMDWRLSMVPDWRGPEDFDLDGWTPPSGQHRWLPLRTESSSLNRTIPIISTFYDAYDGPGWWKWTLGAQQHYSLLENIERQEMWRYRFNTWNYRDLRMGLQFMVMTGRDINAAKPIAGDDEGYFTVTMPRALNKSKQREKDMSNILRPFANLG